MDSEIKAPEEDTVMKAPEEDTVMKEEPLFNYPELELPELEFSEFECVIPDELKFRHSNLVYFISESLSNDSRITYGTLPFVEIKLCDRYVRDILALEYFFHRLVKKYSDPMELARCMQVTLLNHLMFKEKFFKVGAGFILRKPIKELKYVSDFTLLTDAVATVKNNYAITQFIKNITCVYKSAHIIYESNGVEKEEIVTTYDNMDIVSSFMTFGLYNLRKYREYRINDFIQYTENMSRVIRNKQQLNTTQ